MIAMGLGFPFLWAAVSHNDISDAEHRENREYCSYAKIPQLILPYAKLVLSGPETQLK